MSEWYSPSELCLLNTSDFGVRPLLSLRTHCSHPIHRPCMAGMGHKTSLCMGQYVARKSYLFGYDEYSNATIRPADRLISALYSRNASLVIIGDSMGRQYFDFFQCEVRREGGNAVMLSHFLPGKYFLSSRLISHAGNESISLHFIPASELHDKDILSALRRIHNEHHRILFAVNTGLHHHDESLYPAAVRDLLSGLEPFYSSTDSRVVWLETTHENFPNSVQQNGYYSGNESARHIKELSALRYDVTSHPRIFEELCPLIKNTSWRADWRNYIAELLVRKLGHPQVSFFTTNHTLINVVDMFCVSSTAQLDCTHFCYSPLMWQPMYHHLADLAESMSTDFVV